MSEEFHVRLLAALPRLRMQALGLTRNRTVAEDLVQDVVVNALSAQDSFEPGTNLSAWLYRIMRNRFISLLRKQRDMREIGEAPEAALATKPSHDGRLILEELVRALDRLPAAQREALLLVLRDGMSYEEVAAATNCSLGTAKSRVFRARCQLRSWLLGEATGDTRPRLPYSAEAQDQCSPGACAPMPGEPALARFGLTSLQQAARRAGAIARSASS